MGRIIFMALMLWATVAGCNRFPDLTIQISDVLAATGQPPMCVYEAEQEQVLLRGLWDLSFAPSGETASYNMVVRIESYIVDNSLATQATQGNISINTYNVTIKLPDGSVPELSGGLPNPYQVTTSGVIPPSQVFGEISRGLAAAPMIPGSYAGAVRDLVNATGFDSIVLDLKANGLTAGGFFQQSPSFNWPVEICEGCLAFVCTEEEVANIQGCTPGSDATGAYCVIPVTPSDS